MMKKRMMALCLAVILLFCTEAETLYAMGSANGLQNVGDGQAVTPGDSGAAAGAMSSIGRLGKTATPGDGSIVTPGDGSEVTPGDGEKTYTVTFDFGGGTVPGIPGTSVQVTVKEGEDLRAKFPSPTRTGYKMLCWKDGAGNVYNSANPLPVQSDMVWTATWTPIVYKIKFAKGGGTGSMATQTFRYDEKKKLPKNTFTRKGYVFTGWKYKVDGVQRTCLDEASILNLVSQDGKTVTFTATWKRGTYTIRFHANGGSGKMSTAAATYGKTKTLPSNKFKRSGYTFAGWNTKQNGKGTTYANKAKVKSLTDKNGATVTLYAMWKGNPYKVKYDGNGATSGSVAASSHVYGTASTLHTNKFKRKGYTFAGWTTRKDGKGTVYKDGGKVTKLTTKKNGTVTLYAKWKAVKYTITYHTNGGKMAKSAKKTYTITNAFTLPRPSRSGYDFDGWYKTSKLTKRVGEIKKGSTGNVHLYAKWVRCTRKAKVGAAKITSCKATGTGKVSVKVKIKNRIASSDDYYYLVYMNPMNKKIYKAAAKAYKKKSITYSLKTSENQGYATSMFGVAVKKNGKYKLLSKVSYVDNPEKAAGNKSSYKPGKTKKGIQFSTSMEEVLSCDAKQNFVNFTAAMVCNDGTVPYVYNGKTYYFNNMEMYREIVAECNRKGIVVTAQVMLEWVPGHTELIASKARAIGAAPFYSWNVTSNKSREKMEAIFSYLGNVFGKKNCYVSNWVLGNEVNNPKGWNYRGSMSETSYFKTYAYAFRALYYAVRSQYSNAHVFICMDNYWNTAEPGGFSTKHSIAAFYKQLKKIQPGLKWNLAYHAYSTPLTYTNFWEGYGITNNVHSPYITMKNLNVLTNYIKKTYGPSVRIILSEQGYSSTWGQANQAAALAYSYYIAACNPMVDAFIIRSYADHPVEIAQGLRMGISGKEAFKVYKYIDSSKHSKYTKKYLAMIGAKSWSKAVPGYKSSRITKMYRKT